MAAGEPTAGRVTSAVRHVTVARLDDLPEGTMQLVQVDGTDVLLVNLGGTIRAAQGVCSHQYYELDKGQLIGNSIMCLLHQSRFDLETGEALDPPADLPLRVYPVTIEGGEIVLELPEGPVPVNE